MRKLRVKGKNRVGFSLPKLGVALERAAFGLPTGKKGYQEGGRGILLLNGPRKSSRTPAHLSTHPPRHPSELVEDTLDFRSTTWPPPSWPERWTHTRRPLQLVAAGRPPPRHYTCPPLFIVVTQPGPPPSLSAREETCWLFSQFLYKIWDRSISPLNAWPCMPFDSVTCKENYYFHRNKKITSKGAI